LHDVLVEVDGQHLDPLFDQATGQRFTESSEPDNEHPFTTGYAASCRAE
jgi:hypothetical protein